MQKKDAELCTIEGWHNHDLGHGVNNIYNKQNENQNNNMGPCNACNSPHLVKDCEDSLCKRCKPILDSHMPARCPRKRPPSRQQKSNSSYTNNNIRNQSNGNNDPYLQFSMSSSKLNHIAELLEATRKMTRYFKSHINITNTILALTVITSVQIITAQFMQTNTNTSNTTLIKLMKLLDKHVHLKQNQNLKILRTPMTMTVLIATLIHQIQNDYHELMKLLWSN